MELTSYLKNDTFFLVFGRNLEEKDLDKLDQAFKSALNGTCREMLVDCSRLQKLTVAAMRLVLSYLGLFQKKEIGLAFFGVNQAILKDLNSSGLDGLLLIADTEAAASQMLENRLTLK